jgi:putative phosphoesterase
VVDAPQASSFVGLISDTHGLLRPEVLTALTGSSLILHAGDVGDPSILTTLERIAPVRAVYGNTDGGELRRLMNETEVVSVANGVDVYLLHILDDLNLDAAAAGLRAVIYGHTHTPKIERRGAVLYVNPGSAGPRRPNLPVTLARMFVEHDGLRVEIVDLLGDVTDQRWS